MPCLLYRRINSTEDSEILQQDLNNLQDWEKKWMMSFNPDKCKVLRVTAKQTNLFKAVCTIHGEPLNTASSAKYLGLTIDTKLNYNEHVSNIAAKKFRYFLTFIIQCSHCINMPSHSVIR